MSRKRNKGRRTPPARMRDYRIEAQLREEPDLHKLAQVIIGLAMQRAKAERDAQKPGQPDPVRRPDDPVE
ncbi:MAG: hypothetical protein LKK45_02680 [Bifidobacterium psychraerophilum]|jgi:hypothetical protein|uniref:hypothetical protein n=2 Tax=Bifidobacterium TaxID=1678 RepID=UPI0023F73B5E|nr:hypothetical protein [Bifidobacterium psychraerophilum]MCI1659683.1 hypothetical protein [Bifidobacterium psychraerophilum]MCI2176073.1 hypothetical protein [Bifidobacterium psychraerophilum]MCI2182679.1 hypothetical protein [Bifidobacterium psychraerophilum]